jgi:hypothetical protein
MTEKAKAEELVAKYGKDTALACVEELIKEHTWDNPISWNDKRKTYWLNVGIKIKNMK